MSERNDVVWQRADVVANFVHEVRGGVPYGLDQIDVMLRVINGSGRDIENFVDLGCGSGVLASALLGRYPQARGTLIDFSEPMLDEARRNLAEHSAGLAFQTADLIDAGWTAALGGERFDAIVSAYAIHHLTHVRKQALYGEIFECLNPGGFFINVEHVASETAWIETLSDDLFVDTLSAFQQGRGSTQTRAEFASEFAQRPDKDANILAPVAMQCEWLRQIGYRDVDCYFKVFELAVFGGRR